MTEFMQKQIVTMTAYIVETSDGTEIVPENCGVNGESDLHNYVNGLEIYEVNKAQGFYARLSAPGYMDCTDWIGPYDTEQEAMTELDNLYYSD